MRSLSIIVLFLSIVGTLGCKPVRVLLEKPVGDSLNEAELRKLDGTWILAEAMTIHVQHTSNDGLRIGVPNWDTKAESFKLNQATVIPKRIGEMDLLFMSEEEGLPNHELLIYRWKTDKSLSLFSLDSAEIQKWLETGKLSGKIEKGQKLTKILLDCSVGELQNFLESPEVKTYLESATPTDLVQSTRSSN